MAIFLPAINYVLRNEGGLSDEIDDPGGLTKYGLSKRYLLVVGKRYGIQTDKQIIAMTIETAKLIYQQEYWTLARFDELYDQEVANLTFDAAINMGVNQGIKALQRACCAAMANPKGVIDDGLLGSKTLLAANSLNQALLAPLRSERAAIYRLIAQKDAKMNWALKGWLNRAYAK